MLDDDQSSRFVLRAVMEGDGFVVWECENTAGAIEICRVPQRPISMLISDVVLREAGAPETIRLLKLLQPGMAILFISGYPLRQLQNSGAIEQREIIGDRTAFLQKPFASKELLRVVHKLIAAG